MAKPEIDITLFPDTSKISYSLETTGFQSGEVIYSQAVNRAFRGAYIATTPLLNYIKDNSLISYPTDYKIDYSTSEDAANTYMGYLKSCPSYFADSVKTVGALSVGSSAGTEYQLAMINSTKVYSPTTDTFQLEYKQIYEGYNRVRYIYGESVDSSKSNPNLNNKTYSDYFNVVGNIQFGYDWDSNGNDFVILRPIFSKETGSSLNYVSNDMLGLNLVARTYLGNYINYSFYKNKNNATNTLNGVPTKIELPTQSGKLPVLDVSKTINATLYQLSGTYSYKALFNFTTDSYFTKGSIFGIYDSVDNYVFMVTGTFTNGSIVQLTCSLMNALRVSSGESPIGLKANTKYDCVLIMGDTNK